MTTKSVKKEDGSKTIIETGPNGAGIVGNLPSAKDRVAPTSAVPVATKSAINEEPSLIDYTLNLSPEVLAFFGNNRDEVNHLKQIEPSKETPGAMLEKLSQFEPSVETPPATLPQLAKVENPKIKPELIQSLGMSSSFIFLASQDHSLMTKDLAPVEEPYKENFEKIDSLLFEIDARWKSTLENLVQATGESDTYSIDTYNKELDFLIKQKSFMLAIRDSVGIILDLSETHEGHYPDGDEAINEIYRNLTQLS